MSASIRAAVERIFSADYLCMPVNRRFRDMVSPENADGSAHPPPVPLVIVLNFQSIKEAVDQQAPDSIGNESTRLQLLAEAAEGSSLVKLSRTAAGTRLIARSEFVKADEDPMARTVFVKPVHPLAKDSDIADFFAPYGAVEKIVRELVTVEGGCGEQRHKSGVSIQFATVAAASAVTKAHLTYGALPTALGNYFVPKITVMMQSLHNQNMREQQAKDETELRRAQLVKSQQQQQQQKAVAAPVVGEIKKYLTPGRTLKCPSVPANVTWQQIKASLGNLSLDHPNLKGQLELVRVEGSVAYIVLKNPTAAEELLQASNLTVGDFMQEIRRLCPTLAMVTGDEEKNVIRQYPLWVSRRSEARVSANTKRDRE
jgi:hypothetical protein